MSPERAKETNAHRHALVWFRPFRAGKTDYRIPRAALRLPWADMFLAFQADLCSTMGRITPDRVDTARLSTFRRSIQQKSLLSPASALSPVAKQLRARKNPAVFLFSQLQFFSITPAPNRSCRMRDLIAIVVVIP